MLPQKFALTRLLIAVWDSGVNTWDSVGVPEYTSARAMRSLLHIVTNARLRGWGIPTPWG